MNKKSVLYGALSVLMVIGLLVGFTLSVNGRSDMDERLREELFKARTENFEASLKEYLNEEDFVNCGVMITYVTDHKSGERTYNVSLHHRRFEKLSQTGKMLLIADIKSMAFSEEGCSFEVTLN